MLIAVVTYFRPVFWAQSSPFYHLTYMLDQSIRRKENEGTQSWPQARRNGKVWASDLFRPGVYFQPRHLRNVWNWLPYQTASLNFFMCEMGLRRFILGLRIMPGPLPGLSWDCQGCQTVINLSPGIHPTTLWFNFQPRRCQRISRGLGQRTLYEKIPG